TDFTDSRRLNSVEPTSAKSGYLSSVVILLSVSRSRLGSARPLRFEAKLMLGRLIVHLDRFPIVYRALQQLPAQRRFDLLLQGPLQRPRTIRLIIANPHQVSLGLIGQFQRDVAFLEAPAQTSELNLHNLLEMLFRQSVEDNDLIDAVEELGPKMMSQ